MPSDLVASASAIDVRSAGNAGHGPSSSFGYLRRRLVANAQLLAARHDDAVAVELHPAAQALEAEPGSSAGRRATRPY